MNSRSNPRRRHMTGIVTALTLTGLALTACAPATSTDGSTPTADEDVAATLALTGDVTTLDPARAANAPDLLMARLRFDSLIRRDDGGTVVAGLAESWEATATTASFTLRSGLTCSDGSELTASDIAASLTRMTDPTLQGAATAQVFGAGTEPVITADDAAGTVEVELKKPFSDLLYGLSLPQAGIICAPGLADDAALQSGAAGVGSGPYYIEEAASGAAYTLTASTDYAQTPGYADLEAIGGAVPTTLTAKVYSDEATMANDLTTGALDYAGITGPDIARLTDDSKFTVDAAPLIRAYVVINQHEGHPGADPAVREAIAQAIDSAAFNQVVTKGTGTILTSIVDGAVPCASTDESLLTPIDVAAATSVLTGMDIIVQGTNAVAGGVGNEYILTALQAAGANATLKQSDNATWATEVLGNQGDWDVTIQPNLNLTNLLTAPASMLVGPDPQNGGRNYAGIQNDAFGAAFGAAMSTTDDVEKCAAWQDAQAALLDSNDVVPLAAINVNYVTSKRMASLAPDGIFDPTTLRVIG